jgi:cellulose biosynthesis protein BcsQ
MASRKVVAVLSKKGGCGKTAGSHLAAYGFGEAGYSSVLLQTDARAERPPSLVPNRPYIVQAVDTKTNAGHAAASIMNLLQMTETADNCVVIFDGGANRQDIDKWAVETCADLVIIPVNDAGADIDEAINDMNVLSSYMLDTAVTERMLKLGRKPPQFRLLLNAWPCNKRSLQMLARTSYVKPFLNGFKDMIMETVVPHSPSLVQLTDHRRPMINLSLRRIARNLANESATLLGMKPLYRDLQPHSVTKANLMGVVNDVPDVEFDEEEEREAV